MILDFLLLSGVAHMCASTVYYFDLYQIITHIDAWALIANNPTEIVSITTTVFQTVTYAFRDIPTEVFLSDGEVLDLLNYAIEQCGGGDIISADLLRALGLFNNSVLTFLLNLGYSIL
jgi:hypothetical protein